MRLHPALKNINGFIAATIVPVIYAYIYLSLFQVGKIIRILSRIRHIHYIAEMVNINDCLVHQ